MGEDVLEEGKTMNLTECKAKTDLFGKCQVTLAARRASEVFVRFS